MSEALVRRFAAIGACASIERMRDVPRIDVGVDRRGGFFALRLPVDREALSVVDADRDDRCLLLLVRDGGMKSKFLCGFDERHWFVAAIPESARGVGGGVAAKVALQPDAVRDAVARVRPRDRFSRRNAAYVRQGEWFFLPQWNVVADERAVLRNEPLTRGRGKAHMLEYAFRADEHRAAGACDAARRVHRLTIRAPAVQAPEIPLRADSSTGRAPVLQTGGCWFDPSSAYFLVAVAQR